MGSGLLDNKSIGLLDLGGKINRNERWDTPNPGGWVWRGVSDWKRNDIILVLWAKLPVVYQYWGFKKKRKMLT